MAKCCSSCSTSRCSEKDSSKVSYPCPSIVLLLQKPCPRGFMPHGYQALLRDATGCQPVSTGVWQVWPHPCCQPDRRPLVMKQLVPKQGLRTAATHAAKRCLAVCRQATQQRAQCQHVRHNEGLQPAVLQTCLNCPTKAGGTTQLLEGVVHLGRRGRQ